MPFTIPNEADAGAADQAEPDSVDFDILAFGAKATGVVDGCAVTAQGVPDMTVAVAAGSVSIAGRQVAVAAADGTITAADGTNPRFDLVSINTAGTIVVTVGTAAASPVFPAHPANVVVLAAVYVPASDTAIGATQIIDKRMMLASTNFNRFVDGKYYAFGQGQSTQSTGTVTFQNVLLCWPLWIPQAVSIDGCFFYNNAITTGLLRVGLYSSGADGLPETVLADSGDIDVATVGYKTGAWTAVTVGPGLVWGAINTNDAATAVRVWGSVDSLPDIGSVASTNTMYRAYSAAQTYAAFIGNPVVIGTTTRNAPMVRFKVMI